MSSNSQLTLEQKQRIEENRKKAETKRRLAQQRQNIEENKKRAEALLRAKQSPTKPQTNSNQFQTVNASSSYASREASTTQCVNPNNYSSSSEFHRQMKPPDVINSRQAAKANLNVSMQLTSASIQNMPSCHKFTPNYSNSVSDIGNGVTNHERATTEQSSVYNLSPQKCAPSRTSAKCELISKSQFQVIIDRGYNSALIHVFKSMDTSNYGM